MTEHAQPPRPAQQRWVLIVLRFGSLIGLLVVIGSFTMFRGHPEVTVAGLAVWGAASLPLFITIALRRRDDPRARLLGVGYPLLFLGNILILVTYLVLEGNPVTLVAGIAALGGFFVVLFSGGRGRALLAEQAQREMVRLWLLIPLTVLSMLLTTLFAAVAIEDANSGVAIMASALAIADILMIRAIWRKVRRRGMRPDRSTVP